MKIRVHNRETGFPTSKQDNVAVVSWNLLSPGCLANDLDWDTVRLPSLRTWLRRFCTSDVVCVQELHSVLSQGDVRQVFAEAGFEAVVQDRSKDNHMMVNATFFRADRFLLAWEDHRSRVLSVGLLLPDGRELAVVNVHLQAGPEEDQQRCSQMASALRRVQQRRPWAVVACGDFNTDLAEGSKLKANLGAAGLAPTPGVGMTFAVTGFTALFDHVWASSNLRACGVLGSAPAKLQRLMDEGLPTSEYPSDHLPVGAVFRMLADGPLVPDVMEPTEVHESVRKEWAALVSQTLVPNTFPNALGKKEKKNLEKTFLNALPSDEAASLVSWRASASDAAGAVLQAVVARTVTSVVAASVPASVLPPDATSGKIFDPGGLCQLLKRCLS